MCATFYPSSTILSFHPFPRDLIISHSWTHVTTQMTAVYTWLLMTQWCCHYNRQEHYDPGGISDLVCSDPDYFLLHHQRVEKILWTDQLTNWLTDWPERERKKCNQSNNDSSNQGLLTIIIGSRWFMYEYSSMVIIIMEVWLIVISVTVDVR